MDWPYLLFVYTSLSSTGGGGGGREGRGGGKLDAPAFPPSHHSPRAPFLSQGASSSVEDGYIIARENTTSSSQAAELEVPKALSRPILGDGVGVRGSVAILGPEI